jgi:hypothetical protein
MVTATDRVFHAFKVQTVARAIREVTLTGACVCVLAPGSTPTHYLKECLRLLDDRFKWRPEVTFDEMGVDLLDDGIYSEIEELVAWLNKMGYGLLVFLDQSERTANVSTILAKTELRIISSTSRRVNLGKDSDGDPTWSKTVDPAYLYAKPPIPDGKNLDELIPVGEFSLRGTTFEELLAMEIPEREVLMYLADTALFFRESVNELTASRNTGKTPFALACSMHMAAGESFLNIRIPRRVVVGYLEGELPKSQWKAWCALQSKGLAIPSGGFNFLSKNWNAPDLTIDTVEGRAAIEAWLEQVGAEVAVFDSIKTLSTMSAISEETWGIWNQWFLRLRAKGLCVLFLQHTGKGGSQYGSAMQEVILDVSILLEGTKRNPGGASFKMTFPKHREVGTLTPHHYTCTGSEWTVEKVEAPAPKTKPLSKEDQVRELLKEGVGRRDIEAQLQVSPNTISKIKKEMEGPDDDSSETNQRQ